MKRRDRARRVLALLCVLGAIGALRPLAAGEPEELHREALAELRRGGAGEAKDSFAQALSIGNPTPALLYNAAYAAYRRGDGKEARGLAKRALEQAPDDPAALALIGLLDLEAGQVAQAETDLRALLAKHPDHALATAYFGHCLALKGELAGARSCLERALANLKSDPSDAAAEPQLLASLGYVMLRLEDYPGAIASLKHALKIDPTLVSARNHLGLAYYSVGQCREAADAFAQVLRARPDDQRARYHLGLSLIKEGHQEQGMEELSRVVAKGEPAELVRQCRELLEGGQLAEK